MCHVRILQQTVTPPIPASQISNATTVVTTVWNVTCDPNVDKANDKVYNITIQYSTDTFNDIFSPSPIVPWYASCSFS